MSQQTLDPTAQAALNRLFPQIQQAINTANQPVYGDAQKAGYLNNLNQLANASMQNLRANLARTGGLQGGGLAQGLTDINLGRMGQASQFFSQLPFLNRQAQMQALPGLFGATTSAISQVPRGSTFSQTSQGRQTGQMSGTSQGTQTTSSPWWSGLGQGLMGAAMNAFVPGLGMIMQRPSAGQVADVQAGAGQIMSAPQASGNVWP